MNDVIDNESPQAENPPERCVIVVDESLPVGRSANAAAVIALTIGMRHPILVGEPLIDASGFKHPGLIPIGIAILSAPQEELGRVRRKGLETGCDVVDFPVEGQQTNDYQAFRDAVAGRAPEGLSYTGVALVGKKKIIGKIVGSMSLLK